MVVAVPHPLDQSPGKLMQLQSGAGFEPKVTLSSVYGGELLQHSVPEESSRQAAPWEGLERSLELGMKH